MKIVFFLLLIFNICFICYGKQHPAETYPGNLLYTSNFNSDSLHSEQIILGDGTYSKYFFDGKKESNEELEKFNKYCDILDHLYSGDGFGKIRLSEYNEVAMIFNMELEIKKLFFFNFSLPKQYIEEIITSIKKELTFWELIYNKVTLEPLVLKLMIKKNPKELMTKTKGLLTDPIIFGINESPELSADFELLKQIIKNRAEKK